MPDGFVHYARINCKDCGKFVKWGKKPNKRDMQEMNKNTGGYGGMNKVVLLGRLTKDPDLRYTATNNTAVCGFTLAVDRRFQKSGEEKQTDFFPIVVWEKTAEFCSKYFSKGKKVAVSGRLENRNWEDDKGVKHYITEVIADEVDFADSKNTGGQQQSPPPQQQNNNTPLSTVDKMPWETGV
jgi:single-strand DNA-binding protein